jgi:hypothetical protein
MILTSNEEFRRQPGVQVAADHLASLPQETLTWTDDFASIWRVLKF